MNALTAWPVVSPWGLRDVSRCDGRPPTYSGPYISNTLRWRSSTCSWPLSCPSFTVTVTLNIFCPCWRSSTKCQLLSSRRRRPFHVAFPLPSSTATCRRPSCSSISRKSGVVPSLYASKPSPTWMNNSNDLQTCCVLGRSCNHVPWSLYTYNIIRCGPIKWELFIFWINQSKANQISISLAIQNILFYFSSGHPEIFARIYYKLDCKMLLYEVTKVVYECQRIHGLAYCYPARRCGQHTHTHTHTHTCTYWPVSWTWAWVWRCRVTGQWSVDWGKPSCQLPCSLSPSPGAPGLAPLHGSMCRCETTPSGPWWAGHGQSRDLATS